MPSCWLLRAFASGDRGAAAAAAKSQPSPPSRRYRLSALTSLLADIKDAYRGDPVLLSRPEEEAPLAVRSTAGYRWIPVLTASLACTFRRIRRCVRRLLHEGHDAPTIWHLGKDKTMEQVKRRFYWPGMDEDVQQYVRSCDACQLNKAVAAGSGSTAAAAPRKSAWQQAEHGSTTKPPKSKSGGAQIVVFVDKLTKMVHFVPTKTTATAPQLAHIFWMGPWFASMDYIAVR